MYTQTPDILTIGPLLCNKDQREQQKVCLMREKREFIDKMLDMFSIVVCDSSSSHKNILISFFTYQEATNELGWGGVRVE
jgi:hypothetical protein